MAGQGRIVMPASGGRLTSYTIEPYNTSQRASYGEIVQDKGGINYSTYLDHLSGTGFTLNQRPAIYYRPSLDLIDNPQYGLLLSGGYMSQTKCHYRPHTPPSSVLPNIVKKQSESGFYQLRNIPKTDTVDNKTEYQRYFLPHRLTPTVSQDSKNTVTVGPKGESGFTKGTDLQINTFQEKNTHIVEPRWTHSSVMKTDFLLPCFLQGTEARKGLNDFSCRETGYTRGSKAPLACPSSLLPSPQTKKNAPTETTIGKKVPTGSLLNTPNKKAFPNTPFDCSHFTTHYKSMFGRRAEYDQLKSGHTYGGIIGAKMDNGYNRRDIHRFIYRGSLI